MKPKATQPEPVIKFAPAGSELDAIAGGYHGAPYNVLGQHVARDGEASTLVVRAFRPLDTGVWVLDIGQSQSSKRCF